MKNFLRAAVLLAVLLMAGAASAKPAPIPFKRDTPASVASASGGGLGLILVSLLAIGAVVFVRRRLKLGGAQTGAPAALRIVETRRLGPKALLSVVDFGGVRYLIAQGEHGVSCLASTACPPEENQP